MSTETRKRIGMIVAVLGLMAGAASPAKAGTLFWNFSYDLPMSGNPDLTAEGVLTTTDVFNGDGSYTITGITGSRTFQGNIDTITGLIGVNGYAGNDNELLPTSPHLTGNGFSFTISSASDGNSGNRVNVYFDNSRGAYTENSAAIDFSNNFTLSSTPEPATNVFAGIGGLLMALGYTLHRRNANPVA